MTTHEPIFKPVFGKSWDDMPLIMHKHYANRPYSNDISTVDGALDVMCKWYLKPFFWLFGTAPPYNKKNIPVTVHFTSQPDTKAFCFDRIFHYKEGEPYHFRSRLTPIKDNEVIEQMSHGICWHSCYSWNGEQVILEHKGYSLRLGNINIPLPLTWLLGRVDAYENPIDDHTYDMCATITHPLLGKVYEYKGQFKVVKEA